MPTTTIPHIDPSVQHITIRQLRKLEPETLEKTTSVVHAPTGTPVAVIVPYETFMQMQAGLLSA